jgi:hypothetical protein
MDPGSIAIGSMIATGIGTGIKAFGDVAGAGAQAAAMQYKAGVAMLNRQINLQNAAWARESGEISAEESGLKSKQEIGQTLVTQAASGLDVTRGTGAAVRDTQERVADFDQNVIKWDAAKTAWGFEAKAATDEAEANLDTFAAKNIREGGIISALGTAISGAGSVASKWYQGTSAGTFGSGGSSGIGLYDPTNYGAAPTWTG